MYCRNCGTELADTAAFCLQCGAPMAVTQPVVAKDKKKLGLLLSGIAAAVLVAVLLLCLLTGSSANATPESVAIAVVTSEYEKDADLMVECLADFTVKEIAVEEGLPSGAGRDAVVDALAAKYRYAEPTPVEILSTEVTLLQEKGEFIIFRELYDFMTKEDAESITKLARVKVTFIADGDQRWMELPCVEIDGNWYYLRRE